MTIEEARSLKAGDRVLVIADTVWGTGSYGSFKGRELEIDRADHMDSRSDFRLNVGHLPGHGSGDVRLWFGHDELEPIRSPVFSLTHDGKLIAP